MRIAKLVLSLALVGAAGMLLNGLLPLWWELVAKSCLLATTPIVLYFLGFWRADELSWVGKRLGLSK